MAVAGIIIGPVVLFIVGWAIVRGKYAPLVLFLSGVFMLICSVALGTGNAQTGRSDGQCLPKHHRIYPIYVLKQICKFGPYHHVYGGLCELYDAYRGEPRFRLYRYEALC